MLKKNFKNRKTILLIAAPIFLGGFFCVNVCCQSAEAVKKIPPEDEAYLRQLMKDTWNYIQFFVMPDTGFPLDSNTRMRKTNTTNIGLYLASVAVAHHLGYIEKDAAVERVRKVLDGLDKIQNWSGLYNNWLDVYGNPGAYPGANNISDYNKLPAGIIMVRQEFPELADRCARFLDQIPWDVFYDPNTGHLLYEFDVVAKKTTNPIYISRGEDKLLGAFLAVASGKVPASSWDFHQLSTETMHGLSYFNPGWQGGGLFMQYICGLFLDEAGTKLGYSAANFTRAQIIHAQKIGSPVWGWSAAQAPDTRYLGWDQIIDDVVTPHASILAIRFFPQEVISNLKELEKMGARQNFKAPAREFAFGFRDSVNIRTKEVCPNYLFLDQAMIFLSLANFLEDEVAHRIFAQDPIVKRGLKEITEYHVMPEDKEKFYEYLKKLRLSAGD